MGEIFIDIKSKAALFNSGKSRGYKIGPDREHIEELKLRVSDWKLL